MASESSEGRTVSVALPPSLEEWLAEQAVGSEMTREELLVALLAAYRDATSDGTESTSLVEEQVIPVVNRRLEQYDEDLERKLDDVRRRVIQLKKVTDRNVPQDEFDSLAEQVDDLEAGVRELRAGLEELDGATSVDHDEELDQLREALRARVETAARLDERLDDLESKLTRVARAVVALRNDREERDEPRDPVSSLGTTGDETLVAVKRQAAREGIRSADCGACGASVDLSLLPEAACPHCGSEFGGLEGRDGMFSSPRLVGTGGVDDE